MRRLLTALGIVVLLLIVVAPLASSLPNKLADMLPDITKWEWLSKERKPEKKPIPDKTVQPALSSSELQSQLSETQDKLSEMQTKFGNAYQNWSAWEKEAKKQEERANSLERTNKDLAAENQRLKSATAQARPVRETRELNIQPQGERHQPPPPTEEQKRRAREKVTGRGDQRGQQGGGKTQELF